MTLQMAAVAWYASVASRMRRGREEHAAQTHQRPAKVRRSGATKESDGGRDSQTDRARGSTARRDSSSEGGGRVPEARRIATKPGKSAATEEAHRAAA